MYKDLKGIFNSREIKQILLLLLGSIIMALLEVVGVASILPFMSIVLNPENIKESEYLSYLYNYLDFDNEKTFLIYFGFLVLFLLALSNMFSALMYWSITYFSKMQGHRLSMRLLRHYLSHPYKFFLARNTSDLGKNILSEIDRVVKGVVLQALQAASKAIVTLVVFSLLVIVNPYMAFTSIAVIGGAYISFFLLSKNYLGSIGLKQSIATFNRFRTVDESMSGIKDIKLRSLEANFLSRFRQPSIDNAKFSAQGLVIAILPRYLLETLAFGGIISIVIFMLNNNQTGSEIIPLLSLYALAGYRLLPAAQNIYSARSMIKYNYPAFLIIKEDLRKIKEDQTIFVDHKGEDHLTFKDSIHLQTVSFSYSDEKENILSNVSLSIKKNSFVGFVGSTGSGKTTLIDCILGLLEFNSGSMKVDSQIINKENIKSWQKKIGYVPQYIFLIDDSIEANIAFGIPKNEIDNKKLKHVASLARLEEFLGELPEGFKTFVGENGVRLSGGQRQRIGIARALYNDPELLILDEATSSLDGITEKYVMEAIDNISKDITIITIAHRLTTLKNCDEIFLLSDGIIECSGTYQNLINTNEKFKRMASDS